MIDVKLVTTYYKQENIYRLVMFRQGRRQPLTWEDIVYLPYPAKFVHFDHSGDKIPRLNHPSLARKPQRKNNR